MTVRVKTRVVFELELDEETVLATRDALAFAINHDPAANARISQVITVLQGCLNQLSLKSPEVESSMGISLLPPPVVAQPTLSNVGEVGAATPSHDDEEPSEEGSHPSDGEGENSDEEDEWADMNGLNDLMDGEDH